MKIAIIYDKETNTVFQHFGITENFICLIMKQIKKVIHNGGYSHHSLAPFLK